MPFDEILHVQQNSDDLRGVAIMRVKHPLNFFSQRAGQLKLVLWLSLHRNSSHE